MMIRRVLVLSLLWCLGSAGCGSAAADPDDASDRIVTVHADERDGKRSITDPREQDAEDAEPEPIAIPTDCAPSDGDVCVPPKDFVDKLCESSRPNVALTMFRKGTPWKRAYVRVVNMEAWYASGGRSRPAKLTFSEELIILADRSTHASGIRVSGSGSYDVLRWDGTCVSAMSDEVSLRSPGSPDVALIEWRRLTPNVQEALEKDQKIIFRNKNRRDKCQSAGPGVDRGCDRAKVGLARMIGQYVRGGGDIPVLTHIPTGID